MHYVLTYSFLSRSKQIFLDYTCMLLKYRLQTDADFCNRCSLVSMFSAWPKKYIEIIFITIGQFNQMLLAFCYLNFLSTVRAWCQRHIMSFVMIRQKLFTPKLRMVYKDGENERKWRTKMADMGIGDGSTRHAPPNLKRPGASFIKRAYA